MLSLRVRLDPVKIRIVVIDLNIFQTKSSKLLVDKINENFNSLTNQEEYLGMHFKYCD